MKKDHASVPAQCVGPRLRNWLAALALLVPVAPGQGEPSRPGEKQVDGKSNVAPTPSVAQIEELVASAEALLKAGDQVGVRAACKEALVLVALDKATPEWLATADGVLWRLGRAAYQAGDLHAAHAAWQAVHRHREATLADDDPDLQKVRGNLANTKFALGDLPGTMALDENVLAVRSVTLADDDPDLQKSRSNLAATKFALGDLPGALALQEKVLEVFRKTLPDDDPDLQVARGNLAGTKKALGDLPGALALEEKVLAVRSVTLADDDPDLQTARSNLAATKFALDDLPGALALQEKVLAVRSATLADDHPDLQRVRGNLASTKSALGDLPGALALEEKVLAVWSATLTDDHPDLQTGRGNLAATKFALGDLPGALTLQERVLAVGSGTLADDHPDLQMARDNLAKTKYALGDLATAAHLHRAAIAGAVRRLSTQATSLRELVALARQAAAPLPRVASLLDLGAAIPVEIAAPLRIQGLQLLEATRSAPLHLSRLQQSIRTQHPEAAARLLPQLAWANRRLDEAVSLSAEGRRSPDGKRVSRDDSIREATLAKDAIEREWLALLPPGARTAPDAATLAMALAQGEVAISFCTYARWTNDPKKPWVETSQERYGAFLLTPSGRVTWHSLAASDKVDAVIAEIHRLTVDGPPDISALVTPLAELRAMLLDPVLAAAPRGTKSLVLSLADEMHLLPLDDIPLASGELLGDSFSVRSVWSLRTLLDTPHGRPVDPSALLIGGPDYDAKPSIAATTLPEAATPIVEPIARAEAVAVEASGTRGNDDPEPKTFKMLSHTRAEAAKLTKVFRETFGDRVPQTLLDAAASESSVVAQAPGKTYLHFATHGYFAPESVWKAADRHDDSPLARFGVGQGDRVAQLSPYSLTGIALTGANLPTDMLGRREGILTAQEIAHLDLSACYLATLSACETSLGVRQAGCGLASLRQAFHAAGARFVLATLWKVDDKITADLMTDFYTRLWHQGQDPHTALRGAKATLHKRGAPFRDWGGWVLTGR